MFENYWGNAHVQSTLESMIERERIPQTMLFAGLEGLGKATLAMNAAHWRAPAATWDRTRRGQTKVLDLVLAALACSRIRYRVGPDKRSNFATADAGVATGAL